MIFFSFFFPSPFSFAILPFVFVSYDVSKTITLLFSFLFVSAKEKKCFSPLFFVYHDFYQYFSSKTGFHSPKKVYRSRLSLFPVCRFSRFFLDGIRKRGGKSVGEKYFFRPRVRPSARCRRTYQYPFVGARRRRNARGKRSKAYRLHYCRQP